MSKEKRLLDLAIDLVGEGRGIARSVDPNARRGIIRRVNQMAEVQYGFGGKAITEYTPVENLGLKNILKAHGVPERNIEKIGRRGLMFRGFETYQDESDHMARMVKAGHLTKGDYAREMHGMPHPSTPSLRAAIMADSPAASAGTKSTPSAAAASPAAAPATSKSGTKTLYEPPQAPSAPAEAVTPSTPPKVKKNNTQNSNNPAAGSKVGSDKAADIPGYAGSMMGGLAAVGVGAGVGGVTSYATGGEFGKGAVAGGMVTGGAYLGMSTMATNSKAINAAVAQGGEGFGAGVMSAMQGANQVIGGASVAGRRAALMSGAGLAGLTFGGNRRSHRRGFNQSRGSRI